MVQDMKDLGKMIYNMVKERKLGLMDQYMKESILLAKNMDTEFTLGMMVPDTMENGMKTKLEVMVPIHG